MNTLVNIAILLLSTLVGVGYPMYKEANVGANSTISGLTAKTTLQGDDLFTIVDNAASPATKKITVTNATTSMKGFNDLTYSPLFSTSAGLATLLSDETGSSGGFVRATSSVLETPRINVGSDATGDMYYRAAGGVLTRIPIGSNTHILQITGGIPAFSAYTPDFSVVQRFSAGFVSAASSTFASIARFDILPESSAVATTSAQLTPRSMSDYNAYALMSTTTRSGSLIASTSISMATNCNSTTVTRQKGYRMWNYGNVYVFASSTNSQAFQSTLYLSKNGAGTTSLSNSTTNTMWISAVFSVEPGDELQVWCSEDNSSANLTGVSDFAIFATSSQKEPVVN